MQGGVSSRLAPGCWLLVPHWDMNQPAVANPERREGGFKVSRSVILFHWSTSGLAGASSGAIAHAPSCCRGLGDAFCKGWGPSLSLRTIVRTEGLIVRIRSSREAESCPPCAQNTPVSTHNQLLPTKVSCYHPSEFFTVLSKSYDPQVSHSCLV